MQCNALQCTSSPVASFGACKEWGRGFEMSVDVRVDLVGDLFKQS